MTDEGVSVTEGKATIYFPTQKGVFYNPPQVPNRDLSVLALQQFSEEYAAERAEEARVKASKAEARRAKLVAAAAAATDDEGAAAAAAAATATAAAATAAAAAPFPGLRVLDALSASGLRAMRYTKEVPGVRTVVANDLDEGAVAAMRENLRRNGIEEGGAVEAHVGDAAALMHASRPPAGERFDVVDLDPYGTAAPFLDSAVQAVAEGGMLMVTCTDLAVLCGTYPEACFAKYGAYSHKGKYCHEAALRIVLGCVDSHANRHKRYVAPPPCAQFGAQFGAIILKPYASPHRYVVPLLCAHINFYVRLFVRVYTSPSLVKRAPTKRAYVYQCASCEAFALQPVARLAAHANGSDKIVAGAGPPVDRHCAHCGGVHHVGGPLWSAPLHDAPFVERLQARLAAQAGAGDDALASTKQLNGLLSNVLEELPDVPLFTQLSAMCSTLHVTCPTLVAVVSALMRQGHRVSRSHTDPMAIKTDAPMAAVWDVLRCWARDNPPKALSETSPAHRILATPPATEADFSPLPEARALLDKKGKDGQKIHRFPPTPAEWGPGSLRTAHYSLGEGAEEEATTSKRARNQDKRARKRRELEGAAAAEGGEEASAAADAAAEEKS